ncbi:MAG: carbohydrate ABC transporter permease [Lachnospiraceae bacterium]|nr:carbohydrate ABC transporter permease [Lachnospiraceae bacterium]
MKKARTTVIFNVLGYTLVSFVAVLCIIPFIMVISGSISNEELVARYGYSILPRGFSLDSYRMLLKNPMTILNAYKTTIFVTVVGTAIALFINSMTAYVLSRKDFAYRNKLSFFFYFTTLFNGGMVSTYVFMVRYYHLKDNLFALILPFLLNVFYLLIMRSFMSVIPMELIESAKMDGAGEFTTFIKIVLPLAKSGLATIGLFVALDYWNDWYNTMLYISDSSKFTLQYMLYNMLSSAEAMSRMSSSAQAAMRTLPTQTLKLAMTVVATGPIVILYPFVQKYFVKGITVGAVKG